MIREIQLQSEFNVKDNPFKSSQIEKFIETNNLTFKIESDISKEKTTNINMINKKNGEQEKKKESQINFSDRGSMNEKKSKLFLYDYNIKKNIITYKKYFLKNRIIILFIYFTFLCSTISIISQTKEIYPKRKLNSQYSEIKIKIKGIGNQRLINNYYNYYIPCPNETYINETKVAENQCSLLLTNPETVIKMIFYKKLTTCEGMFYGLSNITEIDLSKFDSSSVISTYYMFYNCYSLEILNLTNFNTSKVYIMIGMFQNCRKLKSLDISNFDTSSVENMYHIFENCNLITSLDLSNFNTTLVRDLGNLFYNCWSLRSINLSNFNTISDSYTDYMFFNCTLESIDLSNFNTSNVILMNHMFYNCTFLKSLNLSNIDTHLVREMEFMFYNCKNLEYINFINAKEYNNLYYYNMFDGIPENIVYCINEINAPNISLILKQKKCSTKYCAENWKDKQKQMFLMNNKYQCEAITLTSNYVTDLISNKYLNNITEITDFTSSNSIIETTYLVNENKSDLNSISENIDISYKRTDLISTQYINYIIFQNNTNEATYLIDDSISYISSLNELIDNTYKTDYNTFEWSYDNNLTNIFDIIDNSNCTVNFDYITEDLNSSIILRYINNYINKKSNSYINSSVNHYINNNLNFTITIFNAWYCTHLLLEYDYFEINPNKIVHKIKNNLNNMNYYIFVYINYKHKSYVEIYDLFEKKKINIKQICPECLERNDLYLINNLTQEIYSSLGKVITSKIIENNIDPFKKTSQIFNNICKNFTIEGIDVPIKERKLIIFLGNKEKELVCNDINCNKEYFYLQNLTGVCNCKISENIDNLFLNDDNSINNKIIEEYNTFINSESSINSFLILRCGKEAFILKNLKINSGFFIAIAFLLIQLILFVFYIIFYINSKNVLKSVIKPNPPRIQQFEINDDFEDDEDIKNEEKLSEGKKSMEKENKLDLYKKIIPNSFDNEKNKNEKNIQNLANNFINLQVNSIETINTNKNLITTTKEIENENDNNKIINVKINNHDKLNLITNEKNDIILEEEQENKKKILNDVRFTKKRRSLKNLPPIKKNINSSKESFIKPKNNEKKEIQIINKSFFDYYWEILSLKQPIINLFSPLKCLKIKDSYIPTLVKLMRIVFILSLNIFFNIFHLEQKYFRKKYAYFNKKYNIRYIFLSKNISLSERYAFAFGHTILSGFISFLICFIIQSILNYFFFNINYKLNEINNPVIDCKLDKKKSINNININKNEDIDDNKNKDIHKIYRK